MFFDKGIAGVFGPWTLEEEFDFEDKFYKIKKGWLQPKPIQKPYPVVMNAGGSDKGRHYAAKFCDVAFVAVQSHDPTQIKAQVDKYRTLAREYGREIQGWTNAYIVQGETEKADGAMRWRLVRHTHIYAGNSAAG